MAVYAIGDVQGCDEELRRASASASAFSPIATGFGSSAISSIAGRARSRPCAAFMRCATTRSWCSATTICICSLSRAQPHAAAARWRHARCTSSQARDRDRPARLAAGASALSSRSPTSASRWCTRACRRNGTAPRRARRRARSHRRSAATIRSRLFEHMYGNEPDRWVENARRHTSGCVSSSIASRACATATPRGAST